METSGDDSRRRALDAQCNRSVGPGLFLRPDADETALKGILEVQGGGLPKFPAEFEDRFGGLG